MDGVRTKWDLYCDADFLAKNKRLRLQSLPVLAKGYMRLNQREEAAPHCYSTSAAVLPAM